MAIVQKIKYNSDNQYFAGFLQNIIIQSQINGNVKFEDNMITLILDNKDTEALERFSNLSNKILPNSIFLGEIKTTVEDIKIEANNIFISKEYNIAPCSVCLSEVTDPSSNNYLDDSYVCKHYSNNNAYYDNDSTFFTPHYSEGCVLLLADSSKLDDLCIVTEKEKDVLFSIEKPTLKVTIKDEELIKLVGKPYINIKAPYNLRSTLFALNAKDCDIPYIFFQDTNDLKIIKIQDNTTIIKATRLSKILDKLSDDNVINRFLNISNEAGYEKLSIGANLSITNGISFVVKTEVGAKKVIQFQKFNLDDVLLQMKSNEIRSKLLNNFTNKYPKIMEILNSNKSANLFETLCIVLGLEHYSFDDLSNKSLEFRGNGGLKVDIDYLNDKVDYTSIIGSVISFILAGAETHYIAYSIFEAFGDMSISTLNQLKQKFKIDNIVMMGDMFDNNVCIVEY
jgi:hypothetical protein